MIKGVIVTHGKLGEELLGTAQLIVGDIPRCYGISNKGKSPQALYDEILAVADGEGGGQCIVFVDFFGGSCSHACMRLEDTRPHTYVISGVNLPMLIAFVNKREEVDFDDLPRVIVERTQNSIQILDPSEL